MQLFTDQTGRTFSLPQDPPRRIVSLVPSQTELLFDLGLRDEVCGITKFCVHPPEWFQHKKRIGGTKTVDLHKIAALRPDLILANKEENEQAQILELARHYPVWISDIFSLNDALDMIRSVGRLTGKAQEGAQWAHQIERAFAAQRLPAGQSRRKAAYFIWRKPYLVAAADTFIDTMLSEAGFDNVFADRRRYPEIDLETLAAAQPDCILLSSEPFPFAEKHFGPFREACPGAQMLVVDGELFSWYGSRLLQSPAYFQKLRKSLELAGQ
ncbi:MAG: ABC transporter substrate-binding protein [Saprospiraceae bacterium]|nr:ABC transporter substrate-binding protein [Saprospiraceae bacterium]